AVLGDVVFAPRAPLLQMVFHQMIRVSLGLLHVVPRGNVIGGGYVMKTAALRVENGPRAVQRSARGHSQHDDRQHAGSQLSHLHAPHWMTIVCTSWLLPSFDSATFPFGSAVAATRNSVPVTLGNISVIVTP